MNILLIAQCDHRALTETRRILDQFAERRGDRCWQTPITQAGLDTLRRLLRRTARKNTAVACHWIRGRNQSELLWIVGDARRFNAQGATPIHTTRRDVLRGADENDWHSLVDIRLLAAMAALLHDLGKACDAFQQRLGSAVQQRNRYRHEWISLRLFQAFVGPAARDEDWLQRLIAPTAQDDARWLSRLQRDGLDANTDPPLAKLPPLAQAIGWLVLSHHRLPVMPSQQSDHASQWLGQRVHGFNAGQLSDLLTRIHADWNELPRPATLAETKTYWRLPDDLPVFTPHWRKRAARLAQGLLSLSQRPDRSNWLEQPYVMHLARLGLMLADHHYSRLDSLQKALRVTGQAGYPYYANTERRSGALNQPLDEHLLGVERHAGIICQALPGFARELPGLLHRRLRQRNRDTAYRWQDRAADIASSLRERAARQGAFIVNMASTGCGKTLANARIMHALADPKRGLRCAFALGLRSLSLQTGRQFQTTLQLSEQDLAIQVGGSANRTLFEHYERLAEASGSASSQDLLLKDQPVVFEGNDRQPLLERALINPQIRGLLTAPMLVCTVDHLTPATEGWRGGRQIAPMLRLMSSDLVLDEPDDFDIDDLPALTRLVYWAGLLGSRVLLSSATLPPALVQGLFEAYRAGRAHYQRHRGERPGAVMDICCAWFDEFAQAARDCAEATAFVAAHRDFALKRQRQLGQAEIRRRGRLAELAMNGLPHAQQIEYFAAQIHKYALELHRSHRVTDPDSGKRISLGLVRMANISPLFETALALYRQGATDGLRIHLCVYHSQFPLLLRSAIEARLDRLLDRRRPETLFTQPEIRGPLDTCPEPDQLFIVLASPVSEVGRDHDYDWAIVEPSSMRSLIQLAGRVRRHRPGPCETANIALFDSNLRHARDPDGAAYCQPGFESKSDPDFQLTEHSLQILLEPRHYQTIDARPRIWPPRDNAAREPKRKLIDLEHYRLEKQMLAALVDTTTAQTIDPRLRKRGQKSPRLNAASVWCGTYPLLHLTGILSQEQPFRASSAEIELALLPHADDDEGPARLCYTQDKPGERQSELYVAVEAELNHRLPDQAVAGAGMAPWFALDYDSELSRLAQALDLSRRDCALRYGRLSLRPSSHGWHYHPTLGFVRKDAEY